LIEASISHNKEIFRPTLIYVATNAVAACTPLLLIPVLTRILSPVEYGQVAMFSVVTAFLVAFVGLNVHASISVRFFEIQRDAFPNYLGTCVAILAICTVAVLALTAVFHAWLQDITKLSGRWLLIAVLVAAATVIIQVRLSVWQLSIQPLQFGALRIAQSLGDGLLSLVLVVTLGLGWQGRLGAIATAAVVTAVVSLALLRRGRWIRPVFDMGEARLALRFGIPLIPHAVGGMLIAMTDRLMISNMLDTASTGIYMVALQISMVIGLMTESFNKAFVPWLLEALNHSHPMRDRSIVRFTYAYFVTVILVALGLGLAAPTILGVLVGDKFRAAAPIVVYIALGFAFGGMYYMVTNYVSFARRTATLAAVTLCCGILNVALSYWLLQRRGVVGAAQAFMIAQATLFLATWCLAQLSRPMPWRRALYAIR
jgi:O-antigen/teichoic acid export membrane protein